MQNNNRKKNDEKMLDNNPISQAATLAVLAGIITTLGDGLATVAAALAIQEDQQQANNNGNSNVDLERMQQQLDYLTKAVNRLQRR